MHVFLRQFSALIGRSTTTKMILGTGQKYVIKQGYGNFSDQKWPGDNCQQCLHLAASLGISINIFSVKGFLWWIKINYRKKRHKGSSQNARRGERVGSPKILTFVKV